MKQPSGLYIVIDGQDGTGKTTQVNKLADAIKKEIAAGKKNKNANPNHFTDVVIINEGAWTDSGLPATDAIDAVIKSRDFAVDNMANILLFTAARRELWVKKIWPCLKRNGVVISSRNWWSTLAFQAYGGQIDSFDIERVTRDFLPERYIKPDLGIILTLDDQERVRRQSERGEKADVFDTQPDSFQSRVNRGYETIARNFDIPIVDASGSVDEMFGKICKTLNL